MRKIQEIDLIKYLLLDEKATHLFKFLVGKINIFDESDNCLDYNNLKIQETIKNSYIDIISDESKDHIDSRLISIFEKYITDA